MELQEIGEKDIWGHLYIYIPFISHLKRCINIPNKYVSYILGQPWLAQLVEHVSLDLRVVRVSPTMGTRLLKNKIFRSAQVAQSVKYLTLNFGSGHDLMVVRSSPALDSMLGMKLAWDPLSSLHPL